MIMSAQALLGIGCHISSCSIGSVEGLELVCLNWSLIFVQVGKGILSTIVMGIVVRIDGLRLEASDGIELLDCGSAKACEGAEDRTLDLGHLSILHRIDKGVLGLGGVVLQFFSGVLLSERSYFVKVHFEIV